MTGYATRPAPPPTATRARVQRVIDSQSVKAADIVPKAVGDTKSARNAESAGSSRAVRCKRHARRPYHPFQCAGGPTRKVAGQRIRGLLAR
jgi:hypothetical protein